MRSCRRRPARRPSESRHRTSVRASAAAIVNVDTARDTSTRAAFIGLPASCADRARRLVAALLEEVRDPVQDRRRARARAAARASRPRRRRAPARSRRRPLGDPAHESCRRTATEPRSTRRSRPTPHRSGSVARSPRSPLRESDAPLLSWRRVAARSERSIYAFVRAERRVHRRRGSLADREAGWIARRHPCGRARGAGPERPGGPAWSSTRREVEDVQMGCVTQVGEQALNVGRGAVLVAGWPETVCATTVDRQCGSSLQAAFNAASAIQAGHLDVVVAAGIEHMTRVPMGSNLGDLGLGRGEREDRRALADRAAGDLGRGHRRGVEPEPRASSTSTRSSRTGAPSPRSTRASSSTRSSRSRSTRAGRSSSSQSTRRRVATRRSRSWPRLQPAFKAGRRRDRRQLQLDRRRLGGDAAGERRRGRAARARAASTFRLVRALRRRPVPDASRQP